MFIKFKVIPNIYSIRKSQGSLKMDPKCRGSRDGFLQISLDDVSKIIYPKLNKARNQSRVTQELSNINYRVTAEEEYIYWGGEYRTMHVVIT